MRPDFRIFFACLVGLVLVISAWNVLGGPQRTYSLLAMDQEKIRKVETPLSIATVDKGNRSAIRGPYKIVIRSHDEWKTFWKRHFHLVKVAKYQNPQVIFWRDSSSSVLAS